MASHIGRREFLVTLGGAAAAWPLAAQAQQTAVPVIGYLGASSFERSAGRSLLWFKKGLAETGYIEDRNIRNTAGRMTNTSGCQSWHWSWFTAA